MPRWTPAPIVGGAYQDDARAFSVQDTVNWIPERAESDGTRSDGMLRDAPGAHVVCDLGTHAPIRGLHNCEGRLLAVSGTTLFEVAADYTASSRGSIPGVSRVSIAHNQITGGNEVLIANGQAGYVYNTVDETLAQVTDESYPGAICVDYLAQVLAQIEPQRRFWFHSDLTQATQYISTDQYEAESAPDLLVALIASHGQLLVLGDRTGEFYGATGGNTSFFERLEGTTMEVGCASPHAVVRLDSTVFWVGSDGKGYRLNGYNAQRITTHAIEQAWSRCDLKKAFAFTFEDRGHTIAYFTFPDGGTWGYDVATQEWHRRESKGLNRWRINALVYWNGHWIGGDYSNGKLYRLDWDHKLECCEPLERRRVSGVLHDNQNDIGVNAAEFVFETGGPASTVQDGAPPSIAGSLPDGAVGDVVSYQYTITRSYPGQQVSLTLTGALPTGLSLSATGLVTGTITAKGAFSWSILPAGECVTGEAFADAASVLGPTPFLYIADNTNDRVQCLAMDGTLIANIAVTKPYFVTPSADGSKIYVGPNTGSTVTEIDTQTNAVTRTVAPGFLPTFLVADPGRARLYASLGSVGTVARIDTGTFTVINSKAVTNQPRQMALTPDGATLYITNESGTGNTAYSLDVTSDTTSVATAALAVGFPGSVAISPDGTKIVYVSQVSTKIVVCALPGLSVLNTLTPGFTPVSVSFSPDGTKYYVTSTDASVHVYSATTYAQTKQITGYDSNILGLYVDTARNVGYSGTFTTNGGTIYRTDLVNDVKLTSLNCSGAAFSIAVGIRNA